MAHPDELYDYSRADLTALRVKIAELFQVSSSREGLDDVLARSNTNIGRATALVSWALRAGKALEEALEADYQPALQRLKRMYKHIWALYTAYVHLVGTPSQLRQSRIGRSEAEQANFREHVEWINRLQTTAITVRFAMEILDSLAKFERVMSVDQQEVPQAFATQQWFFERNFLRSIGIPDADQDSQVKKDGGKKGQARYDLIHHVLDLALRNQWSRMGNLVFVEKMVEIQGRLYRTRAYEPVKWPDSNEREDKATIHEMVARACSHQAYTEMNDRIVIWDLMSSVVNYIQNDCVDDPRFPRLQLQRNIFSFRNGIYDTKMGMAGHFYPYHQMHLCHALEADTAAAAKYFDQAVDALSCFASLNMGMTNWFHGIQTPLFQSILDYQNYGRVVDVSQPNNTLEERPTKRAALEIFRHLKDFVESAETACGSAQYADSDAAACSELLNVQANGERFVAKVQTVMECYGVGSAPISEEIRNPQPLPPELGGATSTTSQEPRTVLGNSIPEDAQRMIYVLIGRLLHDLGTFDDWQILLFFKGRAGTGKSAIAEIIMNFYEPNQIGTLANNTEETFGASQLADKFMWACTEVKKNFKLDQSLFQQMVSGENVSAPQKHRDAWTGKWRVPGLICGNEWAAYQDAQASIARRLAIVNFLYPIHAKDSNPNLKKDILATELGVLLLKCNIAYRIIAEGCGGRDIWKILPPYFTVQRRALQIDTDPLIAVLSDETIFERHPASYIALKTLDVEYRQSWRKIRGTNFPENLSDDKLMSALHEIGATRVTEVRPDPIYGHESRLDTWILGLRSVRDADAAATSVTRTPATSRPS